MTQSAHGVDRRRPARLSAAAAVAAVAGCVLAAAPSALAVAGPLPTPVLPGQFFTGLVNGQSTLAHILVTCDGATGHPVAGQTFSARQLGAATDPSDGFTGTAAKTLDIGLSGDTGTVPLQLRAYGEIAPIPTSLVLPCAGAGIVAFTPDPTSPTAVPSLVKVAFVSESPATPQPAAQHRG
jgi:hypothetical protein